MRNRKNRSADDWFEQGPHDRFVELCALSTSGELSEEEQKALALHLAECPDCRQALKEFEAAVDFGMPLLRSRLSGRDSMDQEETASCGDAQPLPLERLSKEKVEKSDWPNLLTRNSHHPMQLNWGYVWISFAAAVVLTITLGIYAFQFGKQKGKDSVQRLSRDTDTRLETLQQQISDTGHDRQVLLTELADRDRTIADLRRRIKDQSVSLDEIRRTQADLKDSLQGDEVDKQQMAEERMSLSQRLDAARTSLEKLQIQLDSEQQMSEQDRSRAENLEAQLRGLNILLHEREETIGKQEELLAHDRDIRELIGSRDLYIAEVYDVARDGRTQKAYGRLFYTKGKSLIFYAYDLDQQVGLKNASAFQAWGQSGPDRQEALSLGIFYEDNVGKKRWVLKFDDPKALAQIDAVFVTVEPTGGSRHPSGKPLLFASLRISSNHP